MGRAGRRAYKAVRRATEAKASPDGDKRLHTCMRLLTIGDLRGSMAWLPNSDEKSDHAILLPLISAAGDNSGSPGLTDIIEMNRSILWVLSGTLHLFETRIPRFRIGYVRVSHSR